MASAQELSDFLSSVEQRAFKQAVYAVRDDDAALDIVQDAMIKLAEKYGDRPAAELPLVFTRILQNRIHDWFRRQKVRNIHQDGAQKLEKSQLLQTLESEISKLPVRQREAFLMRYWDELSITETALAMSCSEGSVKTHCSRATQTLAKALKLKGITL